MCCTTRGRATCSAPPSTTCRRASSRTCCRSGGPTRTASSRTTSSASAERAQEPVLAHHFLNFMLDEKNAYDNFVNFTGYTPPQNSIDAEALIKQGLIPKSLAQAVVRPDQFAANQELLQLSVDGRAALGRRLVEVQGRLMRLALDLAPARPARRRVAVGLLPRRVLRGALRSRSATRTRSRSRCRSGTRSTGTSATCSTTLRNFWHGGPFLTVFLRTIEFVAIAMALSLADRLPGRVLRGPARRALEGARPARADPAVLDQLPDADAGLDQPALAGRLGHEVPARRRASSALFLSLGLLAEPGGWLNGQPTTVDPRARLRLHPVPDPAAVRRARPHRPAPDRGRARPRREPAPARSCA